MPLLHGDLQDAMVWYANNRGFTGCKKADLAILSSGTFATGVGLPSGDITYKRVRHKAPHWSTDPPAYPCVCRNNEESVEHVNALTGCSQMLLSPCARSLLCRCVGGLVCLCSHFSLWTPSDSRTSCT